eukprot:gene9967-20728_t
MLKGLQNLSHVIAEHIKTNSDDIHHTITKSISSGVAAIDASAKRQSGISFGTQKIYPTDNEVNTHRNDTTITTTSSTASPYGWEALIQAQDMVATLKALIADSRPQCSSMNLRTRIESTVILLNDKELYEKTHLITNNCQHFMSLESFSKSQTLIWRGEMKTMDGNISTETFYRVRLKQGMELDVEDSSCTITIVVSKSIIMKIIIKEDKYRLEWVTALRAAIAC